jgi:hypothetical protein
MMSSGMLRRVALVRTDVSKELSASFIRMTRIGELGTTLAVTRNRRALRRNTKHHSSEYTYVGISDIILSSPREISNFIYLFFGISFVDFPKPKTSTATKL